jgi:hypothetical protein
VVCLDDVFIDRIEVVSVRSGGHIEVVAVRMSGIIEGEQLEGQSNGRPGNRLHGRTEVGVSGPVPSHKFFLHSLRICFIMF